MKRLVECVPNFSEGREAKKVDAIVAAMRDVPGVYVLDYSMDADHNRSVVTLAGEPDAVREAAVRGVGKASELIDLTRQTGAHPRIGATDVVPFIPIEGVTIEDCVALANIAAQQIWERFRIPVYLYEAAAQRPERVNLENLRRGQFEGLREEVLQNPDRAPDVGNPALHQTAGATVVGARKFLVAYNINLDTPDLAIAKRIAKTVRFSSGGMPFVKAMGVPLLERSLAQVSMNLTDFEKTPIHLVFETVKREAEREGVGITGSEIVGLIPKRAIEITADYYLRLENFSPAQVFETCLEESLINAAAHAGPVAKVKFALLAQPFVDAVAEAKPAPGGGSVAALAGALGAALGQMVAGISGRKKSLAANAATLSELAQEFQAASKILADGIDRDAASYESVLTAHRMPRESAEEREWRDAAIQHALQTAVGAPFEIARNAADLYDKLGQLQSVAGPSMYSDIHVGRLMAAAAVRGALENVATNLTEITDASFVSNARKEAAFLESRVA